MSAVITGMGVVSPAGSSMEELWTAVVNGTSGFRKISRFDTDGFYTNLGAEASPKTESEETLVVDFARRACRDAVSDSGITIDNPDRVGVALGTTLGSKGAADSFVRGTLDTNGNPSRLSLYHNIAGAIADDLEITGPCMTFDVACASSLHAVGYGMELIRRGRADIMIVGGADQLSPFVFSGFHSLQALAHDVMRPFDRRRDGMLIGEGAALLVLENENHARKRGARIHARVRGWGFMEDATHLTAPDRTGSGMARTIRHALDDAEMNPEDIGYISAHGTATKFNDRMESLAIRTAFNGTGETVPVSSIKPVLGHCLGASGAIETVASIRAMQEDTVPPTLNHEEPDPEITINCISGEAKNHSFRSFLKLAAGFGGQNGALIVESGND
jgi:3-oxoacyl-[acyl-carrier-protein] synthase II